MTEQHPPHLPARIFRTFRFAQVLKGWKRLAQTAPKSGSFTVNNGGLWFTGNLSSYIDRHIYLFGGYEIDLIDRFLSYLDIGRRSVCMDVGANVGNHTLILSRKFERILSFEPNPIVLGQLYKNASLNKGLNVEIFPFGLSDSNGKLDFFNVDNGNLGLGTFSDVEQYDKPLERVGQADVMTGDDFVSQSEIPRIDAMKIDVQGFEPNVLRGLRRTLERDRPTVWLEIGAGTKVEIANIIALKALFPYPIEIYCISSSVRVGDHDLPPGDYVVKPCG